MVGGAEALPFGVLIFVLGTLLIANAWGVVDAKMAAGSAAREAARTYVEAPSASAGRAEARAAASEAMASYGRDPSNLALDIDGGGSLRRCARVVVTATTRVRAVSLPFGLGLGGDVTVRATHSELVDPLRNGLGKANDCGY